MNLQELAEKCKAGCHLYINDYRNYYENLGDVLKEASEKGEISWGLEAEEIFNTGNLFKLQFYPDTPIGFYVVYGGTLEKCLERAQLCFDKN